VVESLFWEKGVFLKDEDTDIHISKI
jgi:hypothetical protein